MEELEQLGEQIIETAKSKVDTIYNEEEREVKEVVKGKVLQLGLLIDQSIFIIFFFFIWIRRGC